uniref:Uncharacterized protein n=1 Tax=Anopheles melas TaxID=34690 RepID=A0A182TLJ3_9DIPT
MVHQLYMLRMRSRSVESEMPPCTTSTRLFTIVPNGSHRYTSSMSFSSLSALCLYFWCTSRMKPYRAFITVSSWLPRLRNTPPGNTRNVQSSSSSTSSPFLPRSTKSPLNTYGFSGDGSPFWKSGTDERAAHLMKHDQQIVQLPVQITTDRHLFGDGGRRLV